MGKSSKKSASKVNEAAVVASPVKPLKKGKREPEEVTEKVVSAKKQKVDGKKGEIKTQKKVVKKKVETSSSEDTSSESEQQPKAKVPAKNGKVDSDSEEESSGLEEAVTAPKKTPAVAAKKADDSVTTSEDESSSDEDVKEVPGKKVPVAAAAKKKDESSDDSEDESSDEENVKPNQEKKAGSSEEESSSDDEEDSSEEKPSKTPKKKVADVEMTDAEKTPKTPATPKEQSTGSKTLFVGNLAFSVEQADVENFFKPAGEVVEVRFAIKDDTFRGFGHVEFATSEEAEKALEELNGQELLGRPVRLDLAKERGAYTPGQDTPSFQNGGKAQGQTIFVRGFNQHDGEDEIRSSLEEHFGSCGEITRVSIPKDQDGASKGIAYIDFSDGGAFNKALELNGSELGEGTLCVEAAKPRGDSAGGGRSGGRGGGRDFGGRSGGGRRGGGRGGGGGRFGGSGGGRFGSGGRRGRGGSNRY